MTRFIADTFRVDPPTSKEDTMAAKQTKTTKTVDITPHWPGMTKWLRHIFFDQYKTDPVRVAITGGETTGMYAQWDGKVYIFDGMWRVAEDVTPEYLTVHGYCQERWSPAQQDWVFEQATEIIRKEEYEYRVRWEIDIYATDPRAAALKAEEYMKEKGSRWYEVGLTGKGDYVSFDLDVPES